jgi:hypothetical protein
MRELARHVDDYLRVRRSLGFKFEWPGHLLHQFLAYLDAARGNNPYRRVDD